MYYLLLADKTTIFFSTTYKTQQVALSPGVQLLETPGGWGWHVRCKMLNSSEMSVTA